MYLLPNNLIQTFFFRSRSVKHAGTLGPAFSRNFGTAIGARFPVSLPRSNFAKSWAIPFILILCMLSNAPCIQAHSPDVSSTMLVQQKDGTWLLNVRSALTAFEYEINYKHGKNAYDSPEKFQELVIHHLKANLSIVFNQKDTAILQNGYVKLGHETNVIFKIKSVPDNFNSVTVINSSFKNIHRSQSALMIFKEGFEHQQFILNGKNNYTASLTVNKYKFNLKNN